jgi:hypothetical protein
MPQNISDIKVANPLKYGKLLVQYQLTWCNTPESMEFRGPAVRTYDRTIVLLFATGGIL